MEDHDASSERLLTAKAHSLGYDSFQSSQRHRCRRVSLVDSTEGNVSDRPPAFLLSTTKSRFYQVPHTSKRPSWYPSSARQAWQEAWSPRKTCYEWVEMIFPMCKWLKIYPWRTALLSDVIAGCTIGFMVVPQSLSYARLGGLPVQYGLYSALTPIYAYACFGSSRQLAVGPVALVNLLLSTGLSRYLYDRNITPETTSNYQDIYNHLTIQISFLVGVVYITMGLLRMGYLTNFLSHAVVSGFTTGAAVIIGASQCKYFVGYHIPNSEVLQEIVRHVGQHLDQFNYKTFILGIVSLGAMIKMKNMGKHNPKMNLVRALGPLTVTFTSIAMEVMFDLSGKGIPIVGLIPRTLPKVTVTEWLPIHDSYDIFMVVFSIAIVGFMESVAIAKKLASQHKYDLDSSMELIGLGMANLTGAIFQSHPVTGSFSRSAVNNEAGAQSGVSGIITATIVLMVLLFLTPVFEKVPLVTLGSIVVSGVLGLLDFDEAKYLWKVHRFDFCVWLIAALGTMFLGVQTGLAISVVVSLLLVFYESAYPNTAILGRLPGTTVYRNIKQYPHAQTFDGVVIVRVDAPMYFANMQHIRDKLNKYEQLAEEQLTPSGRRIKYVILEMSPVSYIDSSGLLILREMIHDYKERGVQMCFSNPNVVVMERFVTSGLVKVIGPDHLFVRIDDAVQWCFQRCSMGL